MPPLPVVEVAARSRGQRPFASNSLSGYTDLGTRKGQAMSDPRFKVFEVSSLKMEDGAKELLSSPEMQPYGRYIEAVMFGRDYPPFHEQLQREKRAAHRTASQSGDRDRHPKKSGHAAGPFCLAASARRDPAKICVYRFRGAGATFGGATRSRSFTASALWFITESVPPAQPLASI